MPPELTSSGSTAGLVSVAAGSTASGGPRLERVTNLTQSYPAPAPYVPQRQPTQQLQPQPSHAPAASISTPTTTTTAPAAVPAALMTPAGSSMGGGDLAKAIRELQAKQTRDITALKTH